MDVTFTQIFDSDQEFNDLLRRLQFPVGNITRLMREEGITNARIFANTRLKDIIETSLKSNFSEKNLKM